MLEKFYLKHLTPQMPEFIRQLSTKRFFEVNKGAKGALPHKQRTGSVSRKAQQTSFEF
jgi:hypothetical protein